MSDWYRQRNWKYEVVSPRAAILALPLVSGTLVMDRCGHRLVYIEDARIIRVAPGYAWDGPTGVPDLPVYRRWYKRTLRASLFHDALYQAMREGTLTEGYRGEADHLFREMLIEDGIPKWVAWAMYAAVRAFGGKYAR